MGWLMQLQLQLSGKIGNCRATPLLWKQKLLECCLRRLCDSRFSLLRKKETKLMLVLLELFCHYVRRQSQLLVRSQNPKEIEFLAIGVWLWQHFYGTTAGLSLPTLLELQFLHRVIFCETAESRMCCSLSSLSIHDSKCERTLSCRVFWWMAIPCNR